MDTKQDTRYSIGEEIAHSVSHGVGVLIAIALLVLLIIKSVVDGGGVKLLAALLMGITLIVEFCFSTLYHAITHKDAKAILRIFDHSAIYLLIAGSYAPFTLVALQDKGGLYIYIAICVLACIGLISEVILRERQPKWLMVLLYLLLGWFLLFRIVDIYYAIGPAGFWLLLAGGLSYSVGTIFYLLKKVPYLHFVFHLFVLAGAICISLSALLFVL